MKRRLSNFFQLLSKDIGILIFAIVFVPLCIGIFFRIFSIAGVFKIPTQEDYAWLYEQEESLKEDFENVYLIEGASIKIIQNSNIKVNLISETNRLYELQIIFDESKEWISTEEICNNQNIFKNNITGDYEINTKSIILVILIGICIGGLLSISLQTIYAFIYNKNKKIKK